jgi:signal transduction histidine kinase
MIGTRALAEGRLGERVVLEGEDELRQLGDSFNTMADRLLELQENVRKQERTAMFGRIAVGLVHDLSHPIQNISNSCRLILKMADDPDYRQTFRRTVDREVSTIKRMLEDLRNLARPIPLERFPLDTRRLVGDIVESMRPYAEGSGVTLEAAFDEQPAFIEGDLFGLGRVLRNLILNAFQATGPSGVVSVTTEASNGHVRIAVRDTGCGIAPDRLSRIFDDFTTTKRRGLGLGLAISRKIVEQLDGRISVESEVGKGSRFLMEFPSVPPPPTTEPGGPERGDERRAEENV